MPEDLRQKHLIPSFNSANTSRMRFEKATFPSGFSETDHSVLQNERTMMDIIDSAMDTLKNGVSAARGAVSGVAVEQLAFVRGFCRLCDDGWQQGWHERNGGNLTYRMKEEEVAECRPFFNAQPGEWVNMGVQADNLAGEYFITTGSGKFFRNVEPDPIHSIGIVEINDKGDSWRIVWGLEGGAKPTSEFPSHFMNHSVRKAATNGANRVIYHCHATNVIALTYILPLTDRDRELARLVAGRCTNKEIAAALYLSEGTVKQYINQLYAKLDMGGDPRTRRARLAEWYQKNAPRN